MCTGMCRSVTNHIPYGVEAVHVVIAQICTWVRAKRVYNPRQTHTVTTWPRPVKPYTLRKHLQIAQIAQISPVDRYYCGTITYHPHPVDQPCRNIYRQSICRSCARSAPGDIFNRSCRSVETICVFCTAI